jgi:hypothetical protein
MRVEVKLAVKRGDILRCQYLIAEMYNRSYEIFFSKDIVNPHERIEPYPNRYAMGTINGELVATVGLTLGRTYVEEYGGVTDEDIDRVLAEAGALGRYSATRKREYTKLVISPAWEGRGLGRKFLEATHCRDFLLGDTDEPHVIVCCAKLSIFGTLYEKGGIRTRPIKPFPRYAVHSLYSSEEDPMESRLIIPDLDIHKALYERRMPFEIDVNPEMRG